MKILTFLPGLLNHFRGLNLESECGGLNQNGSLNNAAGENFLEPSLIVLIFSLKCQCGEIISACFKYKTCLRMSLVMIVFFGRQNDE